MNPFALFSMKRMPLREMLKEHSDLLDAEAMNGLFHREAERLLPNVRDEAVRNDLIAFMQSRPIAYIDKALRRGGTLDSDMDEALHTITIRFLIHPGNVFRQWDVSRPFTPRFKVAVRNAVISLAQKQQRQSKRYRELPDTATALKPSFQDDPILDFRKWLAVQYGAAVIRVFDQRLEDRDTKELIGKPGLETAYKVKQAVQRIKAGAVRWSRSHPDFLLRVARMMEQEEQTLAKRFSQRAVGVG